jgi:hypothetical protein
MGLEKESKDIPICRIDFCKVALTTCSAWTVITELAPKGEGETCGHMLEHAINHINFNTKGCSMVKRGGKEVITVEIFKETYDVMKANAEKRRWNTKDYINTVLMEAIERDKFLQSYAPSLSKIGYEGNILFIRDAKKGKTAEIYLRDRSLYCNLCDEKDCVHIHYALALPETAKLYLQKPRRK